MYVSLIRDHVGGGCSLGVLQAGALVCQTIERPWIAAPPGLGGAHGISCVPAGRYDLVKHDTEGHPRSFALVNPKLDVYHEPADVPADRVRYARVAVLIHVANFAHELAGCIGLGIQRGEACVVKSVLAVERFNLTVPWIPGHSLSILYAPGVTP